MANPRPYVGKCQHPIPWNPLMEPLVLVGVEGPCFVFWLGLTFQKIEVKTRRYVFFFSGTNAQHLSRSSRIGGVAPVETNLVLNWRVKLGSPNGRGERFWRRLASRLVLQTHYEKTQKCLVRRSAGRKSNHSSLKLLVEKTHHFLKVSIINNQDKGLLSSKSTDQFSLLWLISSEFWCIKIIYIYI